MAKKQKTGRKSVPDAEKVILVGFYTKQKNVDNLGGLPATREKCKEWVENYPDYTSIA